ncbi:hypothetical protein [Telluribacter humicola]|uniref:hypothetical protein n=1 Tax=Telluribacter humicola TaxID=1720261 RepID=UPI001A972A04|nr:hypothetical protein [Telluribacter humicola]
MNRSTLPASAFEVPAEWNFDTVNHHNQPIILIRFEYSAELNTRVRSLQGARWSRTLQSWYLRDIPANRQLLGIQLPMAGKEVLSQIHPVNQEALQRFIETL